MGNIRNNQDLIQAVRDAIDESGYKKIWIADQLGISNQALNKLLNKQNFSVSDANKILDIIDFDMKISIQKRLKK